MKELSLEQQEKVSGGLTPPSNIHPGMNARLAMTSFRGLGLLGAAFSGGFAAGTFLESEFQLGTKLGAAIYDVIHG